MIANKLFIVIASLVTIFAGLIIYLVSLDRKISKLEKQLKDKQD
jgi:CcmD family protein